MSTVIRADHQAALRDEVERELRALFARYRTAAHAYGTEFAHLWSLAARHVQGGKLIRPLLLLESYDALQLAYAGASSPALPERCEVVRVAAAIEALHFTFLLHDDVIDQDTTRRGRPNLIGELAQAARDRGRGADDRHWGETGGILAGDLMLSAAYQLFARANLPADRRERLLDLVDHTILETTAGELTDVGLSDGVITPDLTTVLAMTTRKTASYTFELPLRAAVILAGGSDELERALSAAGAHLGLAYQLQDDLLSVFGDAAAHGKDQFSDLREGKHTAMMCFARMTSAWSRIEAHTGAAEFSEATGLQLRNLLRECGAERFVQSLIDEQLSACTEVLAGASGGEQVPREVQWVLLALLTRLEGRQS